MVIAMDRYWRDNPPLHLMVAAYLGIKPGDDEQSPSDLSDLPQELQAASVSADEFDALLKSRGFA